MQNDLQYLLDMRTRSRSAKDVFPGLILYKLYPIAMFISTFDKQGNALTSHI